MNNKRLFFKTRVSTLEPAKIALIESAIGQFSENYLSFAVGVVTMSREINVMVYSNKGVPGLFSATDCIQKDMMEHALSMLMAEVEDMGFDPMVFKENFYNVEEPKVQSQTIDHAKSRREAAALGYGLTEVLSEDSWQKLKSA